MDEKIENNQNIITLVLPGEKLPKETNDLDLLSKFGSELYKNNRNFIREKIKDNWFVIIEPVSGTLMASPNQLELYEHARKEFSERLFFSIGLQKDNLLQYVR